MVGFILPKAVLCLMMFSDLVLLCIEQETNVNKPDEYTEPVNGCTIQKKKIYESLNRGKP